MLTTSPCNLTTHDKIQRPCRSRQTHHSLQWAYETVPEWPSRNTSRVAPHGTCACRATVILLNGINQSGLCSYENSPRNPSASWEPCSESVSIQCTQPNARFGRIDDDTRAEQYANEWLTAVTSRKGSHAHRRKVKQRRSARFHYRSKQCAHPQTLRGRVPTKEELNIVELVRSKGATPQTTPEYHTRKKENSPSDILKSIESLASAFLRHHGEDIKRELGAQARLVRAPMHQDIIDAFMEKCACVRSGENFIPSVAFHGTAKRNFDSICARGLLVPSPANGIKVANGSAHGIGIYTTMLGSIGTSRWYCDSQEVLVLATIELPDGKLSSKCTTKKSGVTPKGTRAPQRHRRKGGGSVRPPQASGARAVTIYRTFGGVRVFYQSGYVLPLFIGSATLPDSSVSTNTASPSYTPLPDIPGLSPNKIVPVDTAATPWVGRHCTYVAEVDAVVWLPPAPAVGCNAARKLKRRHMKKQRHNDRRRCRDAKIAWTCDGQ